MAIKKPKINEIVPDIGKASIYVRSTKKWGKDQPLSEPVLTSNGWRLMRDIKVGDLVYGSDGKQYPVTEIIPQGIDDVYRVIFKDGSSTRCGKEHLWLVNQKTGQPFTVKTLGQIMEAGVRIERSGGDSIPRFRIPIAEPVDFDNKIDLPLPPYALGLLIGNGGFTSNVVTFTNAEEELLAELKDELKDFGITFNRRDYPNHYQIIFKKEAGEYTNSIKNALLKLGLSGSLSSEKFIPADYLFSSIQNRRLLLSGLLNTDGTVPKQGNRIDFHTSSEPLAYDVAHLARSLGYVVSVKEYNRSHQEDSIHKSTEFNVSIMGDDYSDLKLSTKHREKLRDKKAKTSKLIAEVVYEGKEESQCLVVDSPDHSYITNNFIVTHNSTLFRDVVIEKYGDPSYGFTFNCGFESGDTCLDGLNSANFDNWEDIVDTVNWLIETKGVEHNIQMVSFDTCDELIPMAEKVAISDSMKSDKKRIHSIKQAFGGFNAGPEYAANQVIKPLMHKLKAAGFGVWHIAHTRYKTMKEKGDIDDNGWQKLTSNLSNVYESVFGDIDDFTVTGVIDRTLNSKKATVGGKEKEFNTVGSVERKLYFRETPEIDAGGRFQEYSGIQDYMVFEPGQNNAKRFIQIVEDGMEKSKIKYRKFDNDTPNVIPMNVTETVKEEKKAEVKSDSIVFDDEDEEDPFVEEVIEDSKDYPDDIAAWLTEAFKTLDKATKGEVRTVVKREGAKSINDLNEDALKEIYDLIEG